MPVLSLPGCAPPSSLFHPFQNMFSQSEQEKGAESSTRRRASTSASRARSNSARSSSSGNRSERPSPESGLPSRPPKLRFVTATDLGQFRNKDTMKDNRAHVMHNVLRREPSLGRSSSCRVVKSSKQSTPPKTSLLAGPSQPKATGSSQIISNEEALAIYSRTRPPILRSRSATTGEKSQTPDPIRTSFSESLFPLDLDISAYMGSSGIVNVGEQGSEGLQQPMVRGVDCSALPRLFHAYWHDPQPMKVLGSPLDPFDTLPKPEDALINTHELKWHCSRAFASEELLRVWVPELIKDRLTFLTTLCIASAHEDAIFYRPESERTTKLRAEVLNMINERLRDQEKRSTDVTIMGIVQLLCSEIISSIENIPIYEDALSAIVNERGGLNQLGVKGQLAPILTIMTYVSALVQETLPRQMYQDFACSITIPSYGQTQPIPESPLFCPRGQFYTLPRSNRVKPYTIELITIMRDLTNLTLHTAHQNLEPTAVSERQRTIRARVFLLPSNADRSAPCHGDFLYEAVRLAALLYTDAITTSAPLSIIDRASASSIRSASFNPKRYSHRLHDALQRSDVSGVWDDAVGVLFWIALVGSAAAKSGTGAQNLEHEMVRKKYLVALAVRCSVVLAFEHGGPVAMTLRNMASVIETLGIAQ